MYTVISNTTELDHYIVIAEFQLHMVTQEAQRPWEERSLCHW